MTEHLSHLWRQFRGCSLPVIARTPPQTRKGRCPVAKQSFGMCNICIQGILFEGGREGGREGGKEGRKKRNKECSRTINELINTCMYTSHNPFTNRLIINFVITFPCPRKHCSKPWSHALVTLPCLLIAFPYSQLHYCSFPCTLPCTPVTLLSPRPLSWLCASVTLPAIQGLPHVTISSYHAIPSSRQCRPVGIKVYHNCSPAPVKLATRMQAHMHAHTHTYTHVHTHTHIHTQTLLANKPFVWQPKSIHALCSCTLQYCTFARGRWWPLICEADKGELATAQWQMPQLPPRFSNNLHGARMLVFLVASLLKMKRSNLLL